MKTNLSPRHFLLLILLLPLLFSCEHIFDEATKKEPDYRYKITNGTLTTIEVVVETKPNNGVNIVGDPTRYHTLAPGAAAEIWATSGFTDGEVWDEEKTNTELHWVKVSATSNGRSARSNLNSVDRWKYEKLGKYKATYNLVITESDF